MKGWMLLIIGIFLVWTGALCFGYPIGLLVGRRQAEKKFLKDDDAADDPQDVLDAKIIGVKGDVYGRKRN